MTVNYAHQVHLFDPKCAPRVVIIGVGSVGSWVVELLVRMGVHDLEVWDGDNVNSYNVPMSRYRLRDVGRYKTEALKEIIRDELEVEIVAHSKMYDGGTSFRNSVVMSCVDTMAARKLIWEQVRRERISVDLFFDTRSAAAYVEVYATDPKNPEEVADYEKMLFPDEEAKIQTCGQHGIGFAAAQAAVIVASTVARYTESGAKRWLVRERCDTLDRV